MSERTPMTVAERLLALEERVARLEGQSGSPPSPAAAVRMEDAPAPDDGALVADGLDVAEESSAPRRGRKREAGA